MTDDNKTITLNELFNKNELKQLHNFIKKNEWNNIKTFLNSNPIKDNLLEKGLLADYLYYYLQYIFNGVNNAK